MAKLERFYNTFQPDHYDVFIDINRAKKTINGKTTITGNATDPQIAINQKNLQVTSVQAAGQELDFNIGTALRRVGKECTSLWSLYH